MNRYKQILQRINPKGGRYFNRIKYPPIPLSSSDIYIITSVGDRLDTLAHQFYNDSQLWWIISTANPNIIRRDSFYLKPGLQVRIPNNKSKIIDSFERLNN